MAVNLLSDIQRQKIDNSNDAIFYSNPRFVHHLDQTFRNRLTDLYRAQLDSQFRILDLMSSWVSHLPDEINYKDVIGHGMNIEELSQNKQLDSYWIQDLNINQSIPQNGSSIDAVLISAGWQYLQYPENIAAELHRIVKPNGLLIISFSNRAFWQKAPRVWADGNHLDHFRYISNVLENHCWVVKEQISDDFATKDLFGFLKIKSDPFYSLISTRK